MFKLLQRTTGRQAAAAASVGPSNREVMVTGAAHPLGYRGVAARASRPAWAIYGEKVIEWIIRMCGVSAIIFVLAIFFFVFSEAAPVLKSETFKIWQFLFSPEWYPTSAT